MRIAIIGTGNVGQTLAQGITRAGHDTFLASRTPGKSAMPVPVLGLPDLASADLIINAMQGANTLETLATIGAGPLSGKVFLDLAHALKPDMSLMYPESSLGEQLQRAYPEMRVVKSLCTCAAAIMVNPGLLTGPTTMFLSGEDAGAKQTVATLLTDLGWAREQQLDLGGIQTSRAVEHYIFLFFAIMQANRSPMFNIGVVRQQLA